MLLREALALLRSPRYSDTHRLCLVCSFEPLHFKTYLQAFLVERFPEAAPQVTSWGYDQLEAGLQESSRALRVHPALLFLSWGDLHPHLSWRTRGPLAMAPSGTGSSARTGLSASCTGPKGWGFPSTCSRSSFSSSREKVRYWHSVRRTTPPTCFRSSTSSRCRSPSPTSLPIAATGSPSPTTCGRSPRS